MPHLSDQHKDASSTEKGALSLKKAAVLRQAPIAHSTADCEGDEYSVSNSYY